jgi:hypothetical protein
MRGKGESPLQHYWTCPWFPLSWEIWPIISDASKEVSIVWWIGGKHSIGYLGKRRKLECKLRGTGKYRVLGLRFSDRPSPEVTFGYEVHQLIPARGGFVIWTLVRDRATAYLHCCRSPRSLVLCCDTRFMYTLAGMNSVCKSKAFQALRSWDISGGGLLNLMGSFGRLCWSLFPRRLGHSILDPMDLGKEIQKWPCWFLQADSRGGQ